MHKFIILCWRYRFFFLIVLPWLGHVFSNKGRFGHKRKLPGFFYFLTLKNAVRIDNGMLPLAVTARITSLVGDDYQRSLSPATVARRRNILIFKHMLCIIYIYTHPGSPKTKRYILVMGKSGMSQLIYNKPKVSEPGVRCQKPPTWRQTSIWPLTYVGLFRLD